MVQFWPSIKDFSYIFVVTQICSPGDPHLKSDFSRVQRERGQVGHAAGCPSWKHLDHSWRRDICFFSTGHIQGGSPTETSRRQNVNQERQQKAASCKRKFKCLVNLNLSTKSSECVIVLWSGSLTEKRKQGRDFNSSTTEGRYHRGLSSPAHKKTAPPSTRTKKQEVRAAQAATLNHYSVFTKKKETLHNSERLEITICYLTKNKQEYVDVQTMSFLFDIWILRESRCNYSGCVHSCLISRGGNCWRQ